MIYLNSFFNKKLTIFLIISLNFNCFSQKTNNYYDFLINNNNSFTENEELRYKISYGKSKKKGFVTGGYGVLKVDGLIKKDSIIAYKLEAKGKSTNLFSLFYRVDDYFSSYLDTTLLLSLQFKRSVEEGKYAENQIAHFNRTQNKGVTEKNVFPITNYTQDILSALYACRTIPNDKIKINDTVFLQIYNLEKKEFFNTHFIPIKKEKINTKPWGEINTIKCKPHIKKSRVFSNKNETYIWITDDQYHIPVKIETPIKVGSIYIEIIDAKNINYPF